MSELKKQIYNRGVAPDWFFGYLSRYLADVWNKKRTIIYAENNNFDVFSTLKMELGPYKDDWYRLGVIGVALWVLAGFESSWRPNLGKDEGNHNPSIWGEEAGLFQTSADAMGLDPSLRVSFSNITGLPVTTNESTARTFIQWSKFKTTDSDEVKENHFYFAVEMCALTLRKTVHHHGPALREEIDKWVSKAAVLELLEMVNAELNGGTIIVPPTETKTFEGRLYSVAFDTFLSQFGSDKVYKVSIAPENVIQDPGTTPPKYWSPHRFHPRFNLPAPYTHLQPIDVLRSVTGEKEIAGSQDNPLIAHFHEHSPNLGEHSDGADYHDEVPYCRSAMNWACDGAGCEKSQSALAADVSGFPVTGDWIEEGDEIHIKNGSQNHVTFANKRFNRRDSTSFEGFGANQSNSIRVSFFATASIKHVNRPKTLPGTVLAPIGILGAKPVRSDTQNA